MPSLWEKLDWKEKVWLGAVYSISLLLTFLAAYNLGQVGRATSASDASPSPSQNGAEERGLMPPDLARREVRPPEGAPTSMPAGTNAPAQEIDLGKTETASSVTVHVAGQVKKPGVYTLPSGSRIRDALQQAGGAKPDADLDGVNLAEPLSDGQKIYVPHKAETRIAAVFREPRAGESSSRSSTKSPPRFPLDINRATAEELEQLPGIGPVLAARIVEYRQMRGRFQSVDELLEVRGIGPKRLEQIRPYVVAR